MSRVAEIFFAVDERLAFRNHREPHAVGELVFGRDIARGDRKDAFGELVLVHGDRSRPTEPFVRITFTFEAISALRRSCTKSVCSSCVST